MRTIIALAIIIAVANASLETIMLRKTFNQFQAKVATDKMTPSETESVGGWTTESPQVFMNSNANILNQANIAVAQKYNPEAQGFNFDKIISVKTQLVSGVNYDLVLEYSNGEGQFQFYDVVIYVVPWNPSADQVTKCIKMDPMNM